ncbi:hypothetical protein Aab01nite_07350 [Paractinoplanes abujensis]|uniref:Uncharacterized protein n=1 Tax=Paractinoplanes abujensis TaxID=882441 RepID=A0A7W7CMU3_9ACTN|nr:hypothetical protein [Actinoplanes abujensis]MBB4691441.1 hypothetical protein [Actinoplanes abujensis]GID17145.1 hypothetical protein Aab01nite_07350 [Actinoplanes abujensis]
MAVLGTQVTPTVLRSPDGRHLAITEKQLGPDPHLRLRLVDLVDATEHTMPWPPTTSPYGPAACTTGRSTSPQVAAPA